MNEVHTLLFSSRVASVYYNTNEIHCSSSLAIYSYHF